MCDFLIFCLPRSGSAWLANLFTQGRTFCVHELTAKSLSFPNYEIAYSDLAKHYDWVGNSDPGNIYVLPYLREMFPAAKVLVVDRDVEVVHQSLLEQGVDYKKALIQTQKALRLLGRATKIIDFSSIFDEDIMADVWEYLKIPDRFDFKRFSALKDFVINIRAADAKELCDEDAMNHISPPVLRMINESVDYFMKEVA